MIETTERCYTRIVEKEVKRKQRSGTKRNETWQKDEKKGLNLTPVHSVNKGSIDQVFLKLSSLI